MPNLAMWPWHEYGLDTDFEMKYSIFNWKSLKRCVSSSMEVTEYLDIVKRTVHTYIYQNADSSHPYIA